MIHNRSLIWLEEALIDHKNEKNIVITHHGPSRKSLSENRASELSSAAYVSNLDDLILQYQLSLWVHGYLHESLDYLIGDTRIVCNPREYPDEANAGFSETYVIDV